MLGLCCAALFAEEPGTKHSLSIEAIFGDVGLTGNEPTTITWSPDGKGFCYLLRDAKSGVEQLWHVNAAGAEKQLWATAEQLSPLSPARSSIVDERERERLTRHRIAACASFYWYEQGFVNT